MAKLAVLGNQEKFSLQKWLTQHPGYRIATEADCDCAEDIRETRQNGPWGVPVPGYEPFLLAGDFNKDGQLDFAVLVVSGETVSLLIFNGPFVKTSSGPAYFRKLDYTNVKHIGLFLTYEEHWPLIGPFESEGCVYQPTANTYKEDCGND